MVDAFAGTSAGGMLATALAARLPASKAADLFAQGSSKIFANPRGTIGAMIGGPIYDAAALEAELLAMFAGTRLSDLTTTLFVTTYAIELPAVTKIDGGSIVTTRDPVIFDSRHARNVSLDDFLLRDVARATSAAPTYLAPATIKNMAGETFSCVDGGIYDNNPALTGLTELVAAGVPLGEIRVISLGTGTIEEPVDAKAAADWGELKWISPLIECMMDGATDKTVAQLDRLIGVNHHRFDAPLGSVATDFTDASSANIAAIEALAASVITARGDELLAAFIG